MNSYKIDDDNRVHVLSQGAGREGTLFASADELKQLAVTWPMRRLVEIWNALPGVTPVRKFTDRMTAVARIWKAVQTLKPTSAKRVPAQKSKASCNDRTREQAADEPRSTKTEAVLVLLRRENGATLKELMQVTGWQAHSVRGFLSGKVSRDLGLPLESVKREGERVYRLPAEA